MILAWFTGPENPRLLNLLREQDPDGFVVPAGREEAFVWLKQSFPDAKWIQAPCTIHGAELAMDPCLEWNGQEIIPYQGTVCFLNTRTGEWIRKYLDLFPGTESDPVLDASEAINTRIEEMSSYPEDNWKKS